MLRFGFDGGVNDRAGAAGGVNDRLVAGGGVNERLVAGGGVNERLAAGGGDAGVGDELKVRFGGVAAGAASLTGAASATGATGDGLTSVGVLATAGAGSGLAGRRSSNESAVIQLAPSKRTR